MRKLRLFKNTRIDMTLEILTLDNEMLFNCNDIARTLGIKNIRTSIDTKDRDYVILVNNNMIKEYSVGAFRILNNRGELFFTELGLYQVLMKSRKPIAKTYQKWIIKEVLPSARKQGVFTLSNASGSPRVVSPQELSQQLKEDMNNATVVLEMAVKFKKELNWSEEEFARNLKSLLKSHNLETIADNLFIGNNSEDYIEWI